MDEPDGLNEESKNHLSKAATRLATGTLHAGKATVHSLAAVAEIHAIQDGNGDISRAAENISSAIEEAGLAIEDTRKAAIEMGPAIEDTKKSTAEAFEDTKKNTADAFEDTKRSGWCVIS